MAFLFLPYRYVISIMAGIGLWTIQSLRIAFILIITHTTKAGSSDVSDVTIFPHCTVYNTSRDYVSHYDRSINMQFHSAYFVSVVFGLAAGGYVSQRFPAHRVNGIATLLSCILSVILPAVFQVSSPAVFVIRFVQGFLDGVAQTPLMALVSTWALHRDKSTMLSIVFCAYCLSPAIANPLVGAFLCYVSWDSSLYALGSFGILWSVVWFAVAYPTPQDCPCLSTKEMEQHTTESEKVEKGSKNVAEKIPWKKILTSKAVWAIWVASFCRNFVSTTVIAIQPQFFKDVFGMRTSDIGLLLSLPHIMNGLFMFVCSHIADKVVTSKRLSVTTVRKLNECLGVAIESIFLILMTYASNFESSFVFLTIAYSVGGMSFAGYSCNMLDLSPQFSGAVSAVTFTGTTGAIISTFAASVILENSDTSNNWVLIFWLEAAIAAVTAIVYFLFASGEVQPWGRESTEIIKESQSFESLEDNEKMRLHERSSIGKSYSETNGVHSR